MNFNYTKIKIGNWLYNHCFPLYNFSYTRFKFNNDLHEIEQLKKMIKPGDHVLDIGANIGFYAKIISTLVGKKGKVYSFEPDRTNYMYLARNTSPYSNINIFNLAVSDKAEVIKVYKSKLLNVDHRTYPVNNYTSIEEVNANSIDELINNKTIEKVDFIKIDIQGFELTAFKGMQHLLGTNSHLKIITEYWPHGFKRAGNSAVEFFDFFSKLNYQFTLIDGGKSALITREYIVENDDMPFEFSFNVLIEKIP